MSSSQDFLGCTIMKKVEEHCPRPTGTISSSQVSDLVRLLTATSW